MKTPLEPISGTVARTSWPKSRLIMDRAGVRLYLTRYWLLGWDTSPWALMLHKMHRPDDDTCHHDHPWWFITLVLWGGYVEEITLPDGTIRVRRNRPGTLLFRRAEHTHRIDALPSGSCWTLVLRGRKLRRWGFHTPKGWVGWREFIDLRNAVAWCEGWVRRAEKQR